MKIDLLERFNFLLVAETEFEKSFCELNCGNSYSALKMTDIDSTDVIGLKLQKTDDPDVLKKPEVMDFVKSRIRKIIIELGARGALGASDRDIAIVDDICRREGIKL